MRALVLLLLGGGLVLLVWFGLRSVRAEGPEGDAGNGPFSPAVEVADADAPEVPKGLLLGRLADRGEEPAGARGAPLLNSEVERAAPAVPAGSLERPQEPAPVPVATTEAAADDPGQGEADETEGLLEELALLADDDLRQGGELEGFEDPVLIGSCLLHRPHELPSVLQAQRERMSDARRKLVLAYAHALAGRGDRARELAAELEGDPEVTSAEWDLLTRMAGEGAPRAANASAVRAPAPLVRAVAMAWLAREAERALAEGDHRVAAEAYSELLLAEREAPWTPDQASFDVWRDGLRRAQARYRWDLRGAWPSITLRVEPGDSLVSIRKRALADRPELFLCTGLIARSNELRGSVIQPGQELRVPLEQAHALVDLSARWVFYMHGDEVVDAWRVGIGAEETETRPGDYTVGDKQEEPTWFRAGHDPVPFGDPENPLGTRWIAWVLPDGRNSSLGFHGTNDPGGVGGAVSQGCIRMRNEDVEELFEVLPRGASVRVLP